jgi:hypothetical protein
LRRQIASAIDLVVHTTRLPSGRRLVSQISEISYDEKGQNYVVTDLFALTDPHGVGATDGQTATLEWTGAVPLALKQIKFEGLANQMQLTRVMLDSLGKTGEKSS